RGRGPGSGPARPPAPRRAPAPFPVASPPGRWPARPSASSRASPARLQSSPRPAESPPPLLAPARLRPGPAGGFRWRAAGASAQEDEGDEVEEPQGEGAASDGQRPPIDGGGLEDAARLLGARSLRPQDVAGNSSSPPHVAGGEGRLHVLDGGVASGHGPEPNVFGAGRKAPSLFRRHPGPRGVGWESRSAPGGCPPGDRLSGPTFHEAESARDRTAGLRFPGPSAAVAGFRRDLAAGLRPGPLRRGLEPAPRGAAPARLRGGRADQHRHRAGGEGPSAGFPGALLLPLPLPERDAAPACSLSRRGGESPALPHLR